MTYNPREEAEFVFQKLMDLQGQNPPTKLGDVWYQTTIPFRKEIEQSLRAAYRAGMKRAADIAGSFGVFSNKDWVAETANRIQKEILKESSGE
jgi:GH15 family glucan-1,4-alpha-glucosidase